MKIHCSCYNNVKEFVVKNLGIMGIVAWIKVEALFMANAISLLKNRVYKYDTRKYSSSRVLFLLIFQSLVQVDWLVL